ncbi:MAG: hypothetical protein H6744_08335 [Deltaproteobacteria bacterium]|nr:hypothetical protein [Deltaproteobacteria bacterium]MCB9786684.1 hypothetical protein [Deltaproteobacteria bacterium]
METTLEGFIDLYLLPSGRAAYAMRQAAAAAETRGEAALLARARTGLELATATRDLELRFRLEQGQPLYGPRATELDALIDRTLTVLSQAISGRLALAADAPESDPVRRAAARLDQELLPRGVAHLTSLSFVEEHESITGLLTRLGDGGDLADAAATLGLDPYVTKLRQLNAAFGPELERPDRPAAPTWDQIRAARARHQHAVLVYVAAVLGAHLGDDASDVDARAALLGPVMAQQQALAALYRNRRGGRDVDPLTGTEEATASLPDAG